MIDFFNKTELCRSTSSKIVMLVVDGLGGLPNPSTGKSELETAVIPNLDLMDDKSLNQINSIKIFSSTVLSYSSILHSFFFII